jgi:YVTN family beta-propeller protein
MRHAGCAAMVAAVLACVPAVAVAQEGPPERPDTRQVMFVGNNWEGTADIVDARTFERLARINTIPDKEERLAEIQRDPVRLAFFLAIRQAVGEGNDQFTDDMFTSHDGRFVYVSRPSFADVVAISLETQQIVWRFPMEGQRSDHMAISPDGESLLVSDSTANKVHRLDTATGRKTGEFPSGDSPHENNYSKDGSLVFHASIGRVYTPIDRSLIPPLELIRDTTKGERFFQVVDANTMQVLERVDMGEKLDEAGYSEMDSAVRPMALSPDGRALYAQISFHHGFVEYDLESDRVTRVANLPLSEEAQATPPEQYLLDSAHHGLAMNPEGTKLCAAGTMSDYAAIVRRDTFAHTIIPIGEKPYWSTNGLGGTHCWLSVSGDDKVVVIDYASERQVAEIPVGDHPQRVRLSAVHETILADLPRAPAR